MNHSGKPGSARGRGTVVYQQAKVGRLAGRGCSRQQGRCKLCTKPAGRQAGKGRWRKVVVVGRQEG